MDSTMENGRTAGEVYGEHLNTVYRLAYTYLGNRAEAEEASRRSFEALLNSSESFADSMEEKAWLIDAVIGACYDLRAARGGDTADDGSADSTLRALISLPDKYKTVAYLFYCEGLTAREIAQVTYDKPAAVTAAIDKTRRLLKVKLGGGFDD